MRGPLALLVAGAALVAANSTTVVERMELSLEQEYTLRVDSRVEYILNFVPSAEQRQFPARVAVRSEGGAAARPLLLTVRQRAGATTWQLPYAAGEGGAGAGGGALLYSLERTLCPADALAPPTAEEEDASTLGEFSMHLASSCDTAFSVSLRVSVVRDWRLGRLAATDVTVTQAAPRVHYYAWTGDERSVRLVVHSDDDVCATVAVQPYSCPISETISDIAVSTLRMTVQRSGGTQLSKDRYPRGFYVIGAIGATDEACTGEREEAAAEGEWLWEAAVWAATAPPALPAAPRTKRLSVDMKPALTRAQYLAGTLGALALFVLFYVALGALVLAERWPRWRRLVGPHYPPPPQPISNGVAEVENATNSTETRRQRRDSDATFDSSDNSDESDSDDGATIASTVTGAGDRAAGGDRMPAAVVVAGPTAAQVAVPAVDVSAAAALPEGEAARPFGLPARLRVAALARRRGRVLRARSDRYLYTLCTVAVFYALPVVQFVAAFQMVMNVSGSLDLCYYNFLCAHPLGALSDFNHVFSNLGYLLLGALFVLQEYGIPQHYGLLSSLGVGMMVVALLSASYHVCPNRLNFQFDTAFMYVLAVLLAVKLYQARHADVTARAHATFGALAALLALVVVGVLAGGALFWALLTVAHVFTFLLLSLRIYYVGQFRFERQRLAETARALASGAARPLYAARLAALLLANAVNWAFALYGLVVQSGDVASHLLAVLLCNALLYIAFYLGMKLAHGERPRWYAWLHLAAAAAAWAPALYLFAAGSTDWAATPARSRHANHECRVLAFYDAHDLWHVLSAVALYFTFNAVLTWDDGLSAVKRTDIAVF